MPTAAGCATPQTIQQSNVRVSDIIQKANALAEKAKLTLENLSPTSHDSSRYVAVQMSCTRLMQELQSPLNRGKFQEADLEKYEKRLKRFENEFRERYWLGVECRLLMQCGSVRYDVVPLLPRDI